MKPDAQSDRVLLEHIHECIERIREYTGCKQASFYGSRLVQDAVVRNLQTLSESTQRLSNAVKRDRERRSLACHCRVSQRACARLFAS